MKKNVKGANDWQYIGTDWFLAKLLSVLAISILDDEVTRIHGYTYSVYEQNYVWELNRGQVNYH